MAASNQIGLELGPLKADAKVSIDSISELTGFPAEFVKRELLLTEEMMTIEDLREVTINYLNQLADKFNQA